MILSFRLVHRGLLRALRIEAALGQNLPKLQLIEQLLHSFYTLTVHNER
jgi:hypothetical protein